MLAGENPFVDDFLLYWQDIEPFVMPFARLCVWFALLAAVFTPLERLFALHPKKLFRKHVAMDLGYYFLNGLLPSFLLSVPLAAVGWAVHRTVPAGFSASIEAWPTWLRIVTALVVGEVGFYWGHRLSHQIPFLWRFHAIHHSAETVDWLVSTRAHPVDMVFTRLCGLVPLYILGLAAPLRGSATLVPLLVILFGTTWGFFIHANVNWRFGPLEWLIATPAFHHWHHTNDGPDVIDKNFAPMLPWMDRIFGTLHLPKDRQPKRYGIDGPVPPSLLGQLIGPLWPAPALNRNADKVAAGD